MKKHQFTTLVLAVIFSAAAIVGRAQSCPPLTAGCLDYTLGSSGMTITTIDGFSRVGGLTKTVIQSDGKLILTGYAQLSTADTADYMLVRFNYNGTIDTTFGNNGRVTTNFAGSDFSNSSWLWLDPSCNCEKIVMAGASETGASFARYTTQ